MVHEPNLLGGTPARFVIDLPREHRGTFCQPFVRMGMSDGVEWGRGGGCEAASRAGMGLVRMITRL